MSKRVVGTILYKDEEQRENFSKACEKEDLSVSQKVRGWIKEFLEGVKK